MMEIKLVREERRHSLAGIVAASSKPAMRDGASLMASAAASDEKNKAPASGWLSVLHMSCCVVPGTCNNSVPKR